MSHAWPAAAIPLIICFATGTAACAKVPPSTPASLGHLAAVARLHDDVLSATRGPGVQRGVWGIVVHSLDTGERLFEMNPRTLLVPASAAKLITVAAAAEAVGWDFRFETTVSMRGALAEEPPGSGGGRVLAGDLVITGSGDPSIGGRAGEDIDNWIEALRALGIRRIDGRVIGDDDSLEEPRPGLAWAWDDLGYTSGALFGALNYAENRMTVTVEPGPSSGSPARLSVEPFASDRPLRNTVVTGDPSSTQLVWPEQRPGEPVLTIAGAIPLGVPPARLVVSVGNPTLWFAAVVRSRLIAAGIAVRDLAADVDDLDTPLDRTSLALLHVHRSPPLSGIAKPLLKDSLNLYAEAVMRLNALPSLQTPPTNDAALEGLRQRLASWGVPPDGQQLVDGSGLSRRDVLSAGTLAFVLERMHDPTGTTPWMSALPVAGVDGSLQARMRGTPAEGNVRAKTGTMSNVRSLAGYVTTLDGERLAFAVMVNNFEGTGAEATQAVDAVAVRLAGFSRR